MSKYFTNKVELYSLALFNFANTGNLSSNFLDKLLKLKNFIDENSSIVEKISAPIFSKKEQDQLILKLVEAIKLPKEMLNFLRVLIQNNKFTLLPLIIEHFQLLMTKQSGSKIIEIILSDQVSDLEQKKIRHALEKIFSTNIELSFEEDKEILAGIIVKTENKMFDASLKTKFTNLTESVRRKVALL